MAKGVTGQMKQINMREMILCCVLGPCPGASCNILFEHMVELSYMNIRENLIQPDICPLPVL